MTAGVESHNQVSLELKNNRNKLFPQLDDNCCYQHSDGTANDNDNTYLPKLLYCSETTA